MKKWWFADGVVLPWLATAALSILCVFLLHDRAQLHVRLTSIEHSASENVMPYVGGSAHVGLDVAGERLASSIQAIEKAGLISKGTDCSTLKTNIDTDDLERIAHDASQSLALQKFALLFSDLNLNSESEQQLAALLAQRERILAQPVASHYMNVEAIERNIDVQQEALAAIDDNIKVVLGPSAAYTFELLKNSDTEQQQLRELMTKLNTVSPFSDEQVKTLLLSKLTHKKIFEETLSTYKSRAIGAEKSDRKVIYDAISDSLQRYRDSYLEEAAQYVDEQQLAGLLNYEAIQFEEMEASLRIGLQIN